MDQTRYRTRPRQTIIDTVLAWGYEPLEVAWVGYGWSEGGYWAATFREPGTLTHHVSAGPYLGRVLSDILALPCLADELPASIAPFSTDMAEGRDWPPTIVEVDEP